MISEAHHHGPARVILLASALGLALLAGGCGSSSGPKSTSSEPAASTTATTPLQSAGTSAMTKSKQSGTDAAGGAIASTLTVTKGSKEPAGGKSGHPSDAKVISEAKDLLAVDQDADVRSASVIARTQDSQGHWWFLLSVNVQQLGEQKAVITFDGKTWDDRVFGSKINDADLPKDVRF